MGVSYVGNGRAVHQPPLLLRQMRCTPVGCCCGIRWLCNCCCIALVILASLVAMVAMPRIQAKKAAAAAYEALPPGLTFLDYKHSLSLMAENDLPLPQVGDSVLLQLRYKGETPEDYIGLFKVDIQHESWPEAKNIRYWDAGVNSMFKPDREGVWTVTVQHGNRLMYNPYNEDGIYNWGPHSTTHDVETVTKKVRVVPLTPLTPSKTPAKVPVTVKDLDYLNLGCRYAIPPVDMSALASAYRSVSGEYTTDMCMRVMYRRAGSRDDWKRTTCVEMQEGRPTFLTVTGMYVKTKYEMKHEYVRVVRPQPYDADYEFNSLVSQATYIEPSDSAPSVVASGLSKYKTRDFPDAVKEAMPKGGIKMQQELVEAKTGVSTEDGLIMWSALIRAPVHYTLVFATDLAGEVVYYIPHYDGAFKHANPISGIVSRPAGRGHWFMDASGGSSMNPGLSHSTTSGTFAEVDEEGVPIWTMNVWKLNDLFLDYGETVVCQTVGHHDVIRMPDGSTIMYAGFTTVDKTREPEVCLGKEWWKRFKETDIPVPLERAQQPEEHWDLILKFDAEHNLVRVWNSKEHIGWTLEEQMERTYNNLYFNLDLLAVEAIYYGDTSSDRTHANSLFYDPRDKNLVISVRNQDSVYKLNWDSGDESVPKGDPLFNIQDFALFDRDYNPIVKDYDNNVAFFSHQHLPEIYQVEGRDDIYVMTLFDNNNTPVLKHGQPENSYGIAMLVHEERKEIVLLFRRALPEFSFALGASSALHNGNFYFHS
ncbi:arylsulfotransferase, partial [Kipferlia bialata]|eukprot:g3793.t1